MAHDKEMSAKVVEHLYEQGCRHIAHLAGPHSMQLSRLREEGYNDGLQCCGLKRDGLVLEGGISEEGGYEATKKLLSSGKKVDGIYAFSDPVAIGAMRAIKEAGLSIPHDIAVVGFSDSQSAKLMEPQLSSVAQPTNEMGRMAAEMILNMINNESAKGVDKTIYLDSTLQIRASSKRQ